MAIKQVKANRGGTGIDSVKTRKLKEYWQEHGEESKEQVRKQKYKPNPVLRVEIPKPDGGVLLEK